MLKVFDIKNTRIKSSKHAILRIVEIDASILDMPVKDMMHLLVEKLSTDASNKELYIRVDVVGECTKEDIEDLYDYVESALTNVYCSGEEIPGGQERLGIYGLPSINMKTINLLRWVKYQSSVNAIGFEVGKKGSFWKKRMVK